MRTALVVVYLVVMVFLWSLVNAAVVPQPWVIRQHGKALLTVNMEKREFTVEQIDQRTWLCIHYAAGVPKEPGTTCITTAHLAQLIFHQ